MATNKVEQVTNTILATNVSFEDYLQRFDGIHCELVEGNVVKVSPTLLSNQDLKVYLFSLLKMYLDLKPLGAVILQPFVQRLAMIDSNHEPDLLFVLNENRSRLKNNYLDGPADICVEISSPGTESTDRGKKFIEYEKGGVAEYWLFDARRNEALFYRLNVDGLYELQRPDKYENYQTPLLPDFVLHVLTLWRSPLPTLSVIMTTVQEMLK